MIKIGQQPPFRFVDELVDYEGNCIRCSYTINAHNPLLSNGQMSTEGLVECLAQTAAVKSSVDHPDRINHLGYLVTINGFSLLKPVHQGQNIIMEMKLLNEVMQFSIFMGKITCDGDVVAEGELRIFDAQT